MPNFDGGHYFLTTLLPIATDTLVEKDGQRFSPIQSVRRELATLPTALQTPASKHIGLNSPFSKTTRTHFARFVVIEDVMYNGRDPEDAIKLAIEGAFVKNNPVLPQPQDAFPRPYLLFTADFDATSGDRSELTSYLEELWKTMEPALRAVFGYCVDFQKITNGADFAAYIERGQIETTMSFNDYWTIAPPLKSLATMLLVVSVGLAVAGVIIGVVVGFMIGHWIGSACGILIGFLGLVVAVITAYRIVMHQGAQPFPAAPNTDLPSILKALYLQHKFTEFAIDVQGADDLALFNKFSTFLNHHQPNNASTPTQPPGVIK